MNIVPINGDKLPLAIAKEKNGIVLYWIEELGIAGIHQQGIARMLSCSISTVQNAVQGCTGISFLMAETVTPGGLQGVQLISETDLAKLLRHIARSKAKVETRDRADDIRDRLVAAGFKLMVMMELAPAELAARAIEHLDKEIELEKLKNQGKEIDERNLSFRHLVVTTCPEHIQQKILGYQTIEKIEYRDRILKGNGEVINDGSTVNKTQICSRYSILTRNGKPDYKRLNDILSYIDFPADAWVGVEQLRVNQELKSEYLGILDFTLSSSDNRQLWFGE